MSVHTERLKYIPCILYLAWCTCYVIFGVSALYEDWGLGDTYCGKTTHIFKFSALVVIFAWVDLISYVVFPGGGEGARARAIMVTGLYFAITVWGMLMWLKLDDLCSSVLGGHSANDSTLIFTFHHMATIHNSVLLGFMILHEVYLGPKLRCDFTLMPVRGIEASKFFDGTQGAPMHTGVHQGYFAGNQGAGNKYLAGNDGKCTFAGAQEVPEDPPHAPPYESNEDRVAEAWAEEDGKQSSHRRTAAQLDRSSDLRDIYAGVAQDLSEREESKNALNPNPYAV